MPSVEQIKNLLKTQPLEDVYSKNFARKKITKETLELKRDAFIKYHSDCDDFNKRKIKYFTNWVEIKIENEDLKIFPSYLEVYLDQMYRPNGLKIYTKRYAPEVILSRELESYEDRNEIVNEFEKNLIRKNWWTTSDNDIWEGFQKKRSKVELFEEYIYALEKDLRDNFNEEIVKLPDTYFKIYDKHIDRIRLEISELKLFGDTLSKVPVLEKLNEYLLELSKKESKYFGPDSEMIFYGNYNQKFEYLGSSFKEFEFDEKVEQKLKLNLLHQFGIIKHLRNVWLEKKIKKPLTYLISTLISEPYDSVQPRLAKHKDPVLRNKSAEAKVKNYLKQYDIKLDEIIDSKK